MKKGFLLIPVLLVVIIVIYSANFFKSQLLQERQLNIFSPAKIVVTSKPQDYQNIKDFTPEEIFSYQDPQVLPQKEEGKYILVATGDVLPARTVNYKMVSKNNFTFPFEKTVGLLKSGDLTFTNLETPLLKDCPTTQEGMIFCGDGRSVEGLIFSGVDIVNLANNHTGNHRLEGVKETQEILQKNSISVTGNNSPAILTVNDKKFGFLGYNDIGAEEQGVSWADMGIMEKEIKQLRPKVDFLIVQFHWGVEYVYDPSDRQRELGQKAIDLGADLIIGNHPHWVQGVEIYKDKLITYAHGNFVFDQMWSRETREGVVGVYTFNDKYLESVRFYPVIIEDYAQPRFADEKEAKKILEKMRESSEKIITYD
ncbi:CapA family protein [Candidatus Microgenomates bacterium]|nr:CapA family protein [Candidatus Microgenomates bacterium]